MLVVDVGNSDIVFALFENEKIINKFRIKTALDINYNDELRKHFTTSDLKHFKHKIIYSSVVPAINSSLKTTLTAVFNQEILTITSGMHPEVKVAISNQDELGTDLYANAVYAWLKYKKPCLVVDFGTALSFTAVNQNAEIEGVAIAPGLRTAVKALFTNTAQLPDIQLDLPTSALGKDTASAIRSGILIGYEGLVKNLIIKIKQELGNDTVVLATGGLSLVIPTLKDYFEEINQDLTLEGIRQVGLSQM